MLVDLARVADGVVGLGGALCDVEGGAGDDDVGGVGGAGPFLAVGAVAEGGCCGFAWRRKSSVGRCWIDGGLGGGVGGVVEWGGRVFLPVYS